VTTCTLLFVVESALYVYNVIVFSRISALEKLLITKLTPFRSSVMLGNFLLVFYHVLFPRVVVVVVVVVVIVFPILRFNNRIAYTYKM